ncbi:uncharacterized protein [Ptychodera flava]|uniref:uncharacterized protein n=1 Tax=Ptychodera flava TaxID=63121 RepID=UPI00396A65A5
MERISFDYSMKSIPMPSIKAYMTQFIAMVDSFFGNIRWAYINKNKKDDSDDQRSFDGKYGFRSRKQPPQVEELKPFEEAVLNLVDNIKFRKVNDSFQRKLKSDIREIKKSGKIFVPADKTRNFYKVSADCYQKMLRDNITKSYKLANNSVYNEINSEAKEIASELNIAERMDTLAKRQAFITLKHHKDNFMNNPTCRLINPTKSEMGKKISCVNRLILRENILQFLMSDEVVDIIMHSRKTLLFDDITPWIKRENKDLFDVAMGSFDGAEICELVGLYILGTLAKKYDKNHIGLYRDDGLGVLSKADKIRKEITKIFRDIGLKITIETNQKITNFLDVTFNLNDGKFYPYRKPNDQTMYVRKQSNHPPIIINHIPDAISKRISTISSDKGIFGKYKGQYNTALKASGYTEQIEFTRTNQSARRSNNRKRHITWFNPPFSKNVETNIGRKFLQLVDKYFPKGSKLHKTFNRNTIKPRGDEATAADTEVPTRGERSKDGGCLGWLVVLGAHICNLFVFGAYQAIGPLFVVIQRHFEETSARTSWIIALLAAVENGLAPLSNVFVKKIGFRKTVLLGTIISSIGYFVSAFADRIEILYFSIGLVVGFGYALIIPACIGILPFFVRKRFALANVIAASGAGLAIFIFPQLLQALIDKYGWQGAIIVFSALNAQMAISAALFRAPRQNIRENDATEEKCAEAKGLKRHWTRIADVCDLEIFTNYPTFVLFLLACAISIGMGYSSLPVHLLARAESKNLGSSTEIALIVSVMGLAGIIGRLIIPSILYVTKKYVASIKVFAFALCFTGVCNLASPLATDYISYITYSFILGIPVGVFSGLMPQVAKDILGPKLLTAGVGVTTLFVALGSLVGPPCGGYIYDVTQDYNYTFYFYGSLLTFGGLLIFVLEPCTSRRQRAAESTTKEKTSDDPELQNMYVAEAATLTSRNSR